MNGYMRRTNHSLIIDEKQGQHLQKIEQNCIQKLARHVSGHYILFS